MRNTSSGILFISPMEAVVLATRRLPLSRVRLCSECGELKTWRGSSFFSPFTPPVSGALGAAGWRAAGEEDEVGVDWRFRRYVVRGVLAKTHPFV